ncbi:MAG TPA: phosphotransferase [Solirubrobacteraceae bacterium]|nr:phosphotransferase [Solirubrobacteraceae bacterium]
MTEPATTEIRQLLDEETLRDWIARQRWFASKRRSITGLEIVEGVALHDDPVLYMALVQTRFATGTHELYQLPLGLVRNGEECAEGGPQCIAASEDWTVYDALADPTEQLELMRRIDEGLQIETETGRFSFHVAGEPANLGEGATARSVSAEQSNSSIVFDQRLVLKVFRKLEPGINPELEMLRFLTKQNFPNIAPLQGWYEYEGEALASTLGVSQAFLADSRDGWEMALDLLESDPDALLTRLAALGAVTAELHDVLASDASDPAFSPEQPSQEALSLLTATVDEDIERIFVNLPDDECLAPIAGRGQDVRERLATRAQIGVGGRAIRIHGDYHLGQTLYRPSGWAIIDFEGEPARPLPERRQKRSPLRDVASMLRSFAYVTSAVEILRGRPAPEGFEERAREAFLGEYLATVDRALLPAGEAAIANLLSIYELEKAIYELRYELDNRPDWVAIPVAGIRRLLEEDA